MTRDRSIVDGRGPLDRLILVLMLAVLAAILTAAMVMQYAFGEIPCPLCLLQRVAMFGCCFGLIGSCAPTIPSAAPALR